MKIVKRLIVIILAVSLLALVGCEQEKKVSSTDSGVKKAGAKKTANLEATDAADKNTALKARADSPTAAIQGFIKAWKAKDAEALKAYISAATLRQMEESFSENKDKLQVKTLDEFIRKQMEAGAPFENAPETRNEKLNGDKATIEVDIEGNWETFDLVKEEGVWKVDISTPDK